MLNNKKQRRSIGTNEDLLQLDLMEGGPKYFEESDTWNGRMKIYLTKWINIAEMDSVGG